MKLAQGVTAKLGFSLVELMVVIAIVAIIAAVAVPSYKTYMIESRAGSIWPVMNMLVEKSVLFSQNGGGRFGNVQDIGLPTGAHSWCLSDAAGQQLLGSYYPAYGTLGYGGGSIGCAISVTDSSGENSPNTNTQCGADGLVEIWLDPAALGFPASMESSGFIALGCNYWNVNGIITQLCNVQYALDGSTRGTENIIPGAVNTCVNSSCTILNPDYVNPYNVNYVGSTCQ